MAKFSRTSNTATPLTMEDKDLSISRLSLNDHTQDLLVERAAGVATLTINRCEENNRLTPDALAKLERVTADLRDDDEVNAVIVIGAGTTFFSTGILNPDLRASYSKEQIISLVRLANRAFDALESLPQVVIAALNGPARAGAAELALACDIRLASEDATLSFPEAAWGGFPGAGGPYRLASLVGRGRALELICTGREIRAPEMEHVGLVEGIYPGDQLASSARALANRIAEAGPLATRGAKRIIRTRLEPGLQAAREMSDALRHELEWSEDVDEAIAAHQAGRKPRFSGK